MAKQVTLTIDGRQITAPEGMLIVDAAKMANIDIPVFCYHPKMEPVGMCRMCLVEVGRPMMDRTTGKPLLDDNGQPKIQFGPKLETACTNPISEGMVVLTSSEKARAGQHSTVEFLLTSHPLDCPVCDKGGECPLQNLTMGYGPGKSRFLYDEKMHLAKHYPLGDLIVLDQERCIQCARCIRFQDEIAGDPVLGFDERGRSTQIVSLSEPGFDSVFSGNTTDICPVGALTTRDFRFAARPWELENQPSICSQCPVGCNTTFNTRREAMSDGKIVLKRVMPRQNEEVNEIWLCDKGRFGYHYVESPERLNRPQVRKEGKLSRSTWEAAAQQAGEAFARAKSNLLVIGSGRLSNEDLFNLKTLAEQVGGKAVLYSEMGGGDLTTLVGVGSPAAEIHGSNLGRLGKGSTIVVVASDLYEEAPIWYLRIKQAAQRGANLIVANPRATKLDRYASVVVRYAYGDEIKTVQDLAHKGKAGEAFLQAENAVVFFGGDGLGLEASTAVANACARALTEAGHAGKPNSGLIGVWPRANDQGAWELGLRPADDLQAEFDKAEAVYIAGADPFGDGALTVKSGKRKPFLAVQELFDTETAQLADVVFPAQAYSEREGTYISGERRVQRFHQAIPALEGAKPDYAITSLVAQHMNILLEGTSASVVFEIMAADSPVFEGLSYERLAQVVPQWPIVGRADMYYGGTTYHNRSGMGIQLSSAAQRGDKIDLPKQPKPASLRPQENKLLAVPVTRLYDCGITLATSPLLKARIGEPSITLHPSAAAKLGVQAGQHVSLTLDGASEDVLVKVDDTIATGVVLVPRSMGLPIVSPTEATVKAPAPSPKSKTAAAR
ncbi:MAG TPA: NADH-quinone oxidoreductase subunit NuoG [Anaerolineales bacterium]|nr:NADH-quinone oxidoreductase subunit NuoG [Anaerolineales bacterium]